MRIFFSFLIALFFGALPFITHWIAGFDIERGKPLAGVFFISMLLFLIALVMSYTCPAWSSDDKQQRSTTANTSS